MLLGIYSWMFLLCCAVAMYQVVLTGQELAGKGSGAEHGLHCKVRNTVLVFLDNCRGVLTAQPP